MTAIALNDRFQETSFLLLVGPVFTFSFSYAAYFLFRFFFNLPGFLLELRFVDSQRWVGYWCKLLE